MRVVWQVEHIIEKLIFLIPKLNTLVGNIVHRRRNGQEMLEELESDVFIHMVADRQFEGNCHHIQAKHTHPTRTVALLQVAASGQWSTAIKDTYVVKPQKAALEDIIAFRILAVHPPSEVKQQLVEDAL